MLKVEFHIHVMGDRVDDIPYTPKELIDDAHRKNFDVLALTSHNIVIHNKELERYAKQKGILLIPGVERSIERKHVLIYNITEEESRQIHSFSDLERLKQKKKEQNLPFLVIAAHPFHYGPICLKEKVVKYLDLFDAWEYSFFYTKKINKNRKTVRLSKKYKKPLVGNSDVHRLNLLGHSTYTLIDAEKNIESVFKAIKDNKIELRTKPLSFFKFSSVFVIALFTGTKKWLTNKL